ncbi:uncharacterized protein LOC131143464 [Malania oleifera]|uniref:uncharacterized protein LOC131143464 n=1 Tax=Malania oleifera TaxID=397392 RepID=UPI0025AEBCBA|nr:uncharacterized protein LOC131143464 [Malania oleifera]
MAKNRNKKKRNGVVPMDVTDQIISDIPQAMETSESVPSVAAAGAPNRKMKKGVQMKRSKSARKMKAIAKAISKNEQSREKVLKKDSKKLGTQSAKMLYD